MTERVERGSTVFRDGGSMGISGFLEFVGDRTTVHEQRLF